MKSRCGWLTTQHDRLLEDLDTKSVLHLCSVCELGGAPSENRAVLYRQTEVQEQQCSLFPIYRRLPKLDVVGSSPISRSSFTIAVERFFPSEDERVGHSRFDGSSN